MVTKLILLFLELIFLYSFKAWNVSNSKKTIKTKCRSTLTQSYLTHEEKTKANIIS